MEHLKGDQDEGYYLEAYRKLPKPEPEVLDFWLYFSYHSCQH